MGYVAAGTRKAGTHGDEPPIPADDHVGWFHRTFRQRAPGGYRKRTVRGLRSKNRPLGIKKGNASNDGGPHLIAIIMLALDEIPSQASGEPNYYVAAQRAVLRCEGMDDLPDVFRTLIEKEEAEVIRAIDRAVLARVRRVHRALTAEAGRGLSGHVQWLRTQPDVLADLAIMARGIIAQEHANDERSR